MHHSGRSRTRQTGLLLLFPGHLKPSGILVFTQSLVKATFPRALEITILINRPFLFCYDFCVTCIGLFHNITSLGWIPESSFPIILSCLLVSLVTPPATCVFLFTTQKRNPILRIPVILVLINYLHQVSLTDEQPLAMGGALNHHRYSGRGLDPAMVTSRIRS